MELENYFLNKKEQMIDFLKELVIRESPTDKKEEVDKCSTFLIKELKKLGLKIFRIKQKKVGDFFIAEYPGLTKEQILILAHLDTIWGKGKIEQMPFRIEGDKIFGPGVLDMKVGLTMIYYSFLGLKNLALKPKKKICVFFNSEEETGSHYAERYIVDLAKKSKYVLCLEPSLPGGALKMQRKGRIAARLEAIGKAAHGSTPEKGINAILELTNHLLYIKKLQTKGISVNVGLIKGGEKPNIVPGKAEAILDIRFWKKEDKEKVIAFFKNLKPKLKGAKIDFKVISYRPPMERTKASQVLFRKIKKIAEEIGMELIWGKSSGGSDASFASNLDIPTADGLGPEGEGIHSENEQLIIPSLIQRTALLTKIITQL
ncbi:MAG: M20 family metallopeptidase [Candidatus Aminicenantia bacterium]